MTTRQQSRASVFAAAYEDAKLSFPKLSRKKRRELARNGAKLIVKAHKGIESARAVSE